MTYAPATITSAAAYWVKKGGINSGIVGNMSHCKGYHLGKDRIYGTCACKPDGVCKPGLRDLDYSVKLTRDKAGLTNASAALDLGHATKSVLRAYSRWLVSQCQKNAPGTSDVREVIYSPDGLVVKRWDNHTKTLHTGGDGTGQGDNTHLWHTHISFFRDSESRAKTPWLFTPFFEPVVPVEDTMPQVTEYKPGQVAAITGNVRKTPYVTTTNLIRLVPSTTPETWVVIGKVKGELHEGSDIWLMRVNVAAGNTYEYTHSSNIKAGPAPAPDGSPYTQADIDAAVAANEKKWEDWTATHP